MEVFLHGYSRSHVTLSVQSHQNNGDRYLQTIHRNFASLILTFLRREIEDIALNNQGINVGTLIPSFKIDPEITNDY